MMDPQLWIACWYGAHAGMGALLGGGVAHVIAGRPAAGLFAVLGAFAGARIAAERFWG
jgi:hypothetical protein